ncbi:1-phosphofructokinase family hexose kinase [Microbacterium arabinogalactanolyticum]|uniref:Sugar kinase n=1 Tax=Microbacterium arabinogalactanolyticum TaxID=69365 RepID=A0ABQ5NE23_9MICO|nr:1-phosphofructokinase family hexose kinase [Microbacterium arabinogalactanolyticum]GLC84048.1 sugar kinase [Microbacterium arabinogalactanolyticum]
MIITVTPNPALDLTWHVAALEIGGVHRADAGKSRAGGKGLNVARVAHAQGASAVAITTSGGATGAEFAAELDASGVPHVLVPVTASTRRSIALVDEALGDTTIVNERGEAPTDVEWTALKDAVARALARVSASDARADGLGDAAGPDAGGQDVLVISGSLPPGTPDDLLPSLIRLGRDAGAAVIVDTSGPAMLTAADAGASVLKPNQHELRDATGLDDPIEGARELLRRGVELVLLSLGADGMLAVSAAPSEPRASGTPGEEREHDGELRADAAPVSILHARLDTALAGNPTGAGDAGVAACAVLMDAGNHDPEAILRRATAWSAAAVLMPLAGDIHPSWPELEHALTVTARPDSVDAHPGPERQLPERESRAADPGTAESDPKETR